MSLTRRQLLLFSLCAPACAKGVLDWQRRNLLIAAQLDDMHTGGQFMLIKPDSVQKVGAHPEKFFHGHPLVASAAINRSDVRFLCSALAKSLRRYSIKDGIYECFDPHHALRVGSVDMLICFECAQVLFFGKGRPLVGYLRGGREAFDQLATELGLIKPKANSNPNPMTY